VICFLSHCALCFIGAIEGAYFLKYGKLKVMAEQELMDCSWDQGNNACDGGEDYRAFDWILQNGGMSFKENYGAICLLRRCALCSIGAIEGAYAHVFSHLCLVCS